MTLLDMGFAEVLAQLSGGRQEKNAIFWISVLAF
jgi:hypothetical protein